MKVSIITKHANTGETEIIKRTVREAGEIKYILKSNGYMPVVETKTTAYKTIGYWFCDKDKMINHLEGQRKSQLFNLNN